MDRPTPEDIAKTQSIMKIMGLTVEEACWIFHSGFCCRKDCSNCTEQSEE